MNAQEYAQFVTAQWIGITGAGVGLIYLALAIYHGRKAVR